MGTVETIEAVVAPVLSGLGIELVDVESHPGHLVVTIEREEGLDLGAISRATNAVSRALDEADAVPGGRYELEVTSPGLERPLKRPEHFRRHVGSEIALRLRAGVAPEGGERRLGGLLASAGDASFCLLRPSGEEQEIAYADLERAHTVFDWRAALAETRTPERRPRREGRPSAADRSRAATAARGAAAHHRSDRTRPTDADRHVTENS